MRKLAAFSHTRWLMLAGGTLLALCVYYLNYTVTSFAEGEIQGSSPLTLLLRASAVLAIFGALSPLRLCTGSALIFVAFQLLSVIGLLLTAAIHGGLNDSLFFNSLLQLPVLLALMGTRWRVDHARWMGLICRALALQTGIDAVVWQSGNSLWLSGAFVGGVGNPTSFGFLCAVGLAFCVFHPCASRWRWALAGILALGAIMSKALFAALAVALVTGVWMTKGWRRALAGLCVGALVVVAALIPMAVNDQDQDTAFVVHKMKAAGAFVGLVEYDVESSASVSQRAEMHEQTLAAIIAAPECLLWGHLEGLPYWPMDSQLLTYLGSFGAAALMVFLLIHGFWTWRAWKVRGQDGGFALVALLLFGIIFTTNRVLDYFPVATLYFLVVATVLRPAARFSETQGSSPVRSDHGSIQLSCPAPQTTAPGASTPASPAPE